MKILKRKILPALSRILLAILCAHYILYVPQQRPLYWLLHQKGYYIALVFSAIVAWLLIFISQQLHRLLNRLLPWELNVVRRLLAQLLLGIGLVLLIDLVLVRLYFWYFHRDFKHSGYLQVEVQMVLWMLICLNVFLVGEDFYQERKKEKLLRSQELEFIHFIYGSRGNKKCKIALDEVICFYNESHIGYVYLINSEVWNTDYTMKQLEAALHPCFGFRINRSLLVNWQAIKAYEPIANMQGKVVIKYPLDEHAKLNLRVSRNRFKDFKNYYNQYKVLAQ